MRNLALVTGAVAGLLGVGVQAFLGVVPPPAYGICIVCHGRDLVSWVVNRLFGTKLAVAPVSASFPLLTVVGIVVGAHLAAREYGEYRRHRTGHPAVHFLLGALVMVSGLLVMACPIRLILRLAYGDPFGLLGLVGMVAGVALGTAYLKRRAVG